MEKLCKNCLDWKDKRSCESRTINYVGKPIEYGCAPKDFSGYRAELVTGPDFGCTNFRIKEYSSLGEND